MASQPVSLPPRLGCLRGRDDLLSDLRRRLASGPGRLVALCGLGGVGKSSVAAEYAHRNLGGAGLAWFLPSEDPALLDAEFTRLAGQLGVTDPVAPGDPVAGVHGALAAMPSPWILVFDSAVTAVIHARMSSARSSKRTAAGTSCGCSMHRSLNLLLAGSRTQLLTANGSQSNKPARPSKLHSGRLAIARRIDRDVLGRDRLRVPLDHARAQRGRRAAVPLAFHWGFHVRHCEIRPGWVPPRPRGQRCSSWPDAVPGQRLPLPSGQSLHPAPASHRGATHHEESTEVRAIHPSSLPLARNPRIGREPSGFTLCSTPSRYRQCAIGRGRA